MRKTHSSVYLEVFSSTPDNPHGACTQGCPKCPNVAPPSSTILDYSDAQRLALKRITNDHLHPQAPLKLTLPLHINNNVPHLDLPTQRTDELSLSFGKIPQKENIVAFVMKTFQSIIQLFGDILPKSIQFDFTPEDTHKGVLSDNETMNLIFLINSIVTALIGKTHNIVFSLARNHSAQESVQKNSADQHFCVAELQSILRIAIENIIQPQVIYTDFQTHIDDDGMPWMVRTHTNIHSNKLDLELGYRNIHPGANIDPIHNIPDASHAERAGVNLSLFPNSVWAYHAAYGLPLYVDKTLQISYPELFQILDRCEQLKGLSLAMAINAHIRRKLKVK